MKAFPNNNFDSMESRGMDLRDYFAAKAMQSLLSGITNNCDPDEQTIVAHLAYEFSDEMMMARNE